MICLVRIQSGDVFANPPLGLLYVGGALKKAGYEVKVFNISEREIERCAEEIIKKDPMWVGFSVNTGWSAGTALAMSCRIKAKSSSPIVWGGAHASLLPQQCLQEQAIDFAVVGEGEVTAVELTTAIERKQEFEAIKGLAFKRRDGTMVVNPEREFISNLDLHRMDWSLVDAERYARPLPEFGMKRAFQFITSRGCPHRCGFCYNQRVNHRRWRAHSHGFVIREVCALKSALNLDGIRFWDDNFFTDRRRAFSIIDAIDLPYTTEIRVDYIDSQVARRLHETRCRMVLLGLESGSDRILNMIHKDTGVDRNFAALMELNRFPEIKIHPSFIVGFPTETEDEFKQTIDFFARMIRTNPNFWFVRLGLYVPYPGGELFDAAVKQGFVPPGRVEHWDDLRWDTSVTRAISCVPWIQSKDDIRKDEQYLQMLYRIVKSRFPFGFLARVIHARIKHRYYHFELERACFLAVSGLKNTINWLLRAVGLRPC